MKLPIPAFAYPIILLWVIAIVVSLTHYHPGFLTYRQFTGGLFFGAAAASVFILIRGIRAQRK
ncbi:hypothetical protein [Hymenobacter cellulosivorans]|uniref:Uncharacterized protein n=1 Tax=Hymenobacter cellulosivorans TaxID=2932249 RepID=A0ABY4FF22_9BACT|nr:hypothetical protein [Hymenobacter cellulosivorans]UOQ53036.1 hypothetical protein MUN80_25280 [Hymenobacter cellulosivorans]